MFCKDTNSMALRFYHGAGHGTRKRTRRCDYRILSGTTVPALTFVSKKSKQRYTVVVSAITLVSNALQYTYGFVSEGIVSDNMARAGMLVTVSNTTVRPWRRK